MMGNASVTELVLSVFALQFVDTVKKIKKELRPLFDRGK